MTARHRFSSWAAVFAFAMVFLAAPVLASPPVAAGAPDGCPDVELVFARGTFEPSGLGRVGDALASSLQSRLPERTVGAYAVNYPASLDFGRAAEGVADASGHIRRLVERCPDTDIVLGGYSQGAAVSAYVTSDTVPAGVVLPAGIDGVLPTAIAEHVAAVTLFGTPSSEVVQLARRGSPPLVLGAPYAGKTLDLCAPADPVCQPGSLDRAAHSSYTVNGMVDRAADFVAGRLQTH
ncbi:cutinase family protein [Mycobacterium sp. ACS4331]|uniref:cutinase family protein n=1 Tax=Mycobacterium sp. ACS4331 TaxID=1834121 RepID=UPI0007FC5177|nr:cutinase family protein [Mycobacterium sp. ACS4331]OBF25079.1 cutinase [Mycobacterium sp. ACS4331]